MTLVQPKEIWEVNNGKYYDNMRGPCDSLFHVPTQNEWNSLVAKINSLNMSDTYGERFRKFLKMPYVGLATGSGKQSAGTQGYYACSTSQGSLSRAAYLFFFAISTSSSSIQGYYLQYGYSIRPFRDTITIPDNTWTTLYDGSSVATGAGIFHNSSLGVISISSDGANWQTIADKNLGATAVYNDGDTLSEANCGKFYQWGNNYAFAFSGNFTKSSTAIDSTGYGPGNYYSSSTFINTAPTYAPRNHNMRGGQRGPNKKPVKKVYVGSTLVRPLYTPGANTVLYIPMNTDFLDHSGNNYQGDGGHGTYSIQTVNGVNAGYWSGGYIRFTGLTGLKANSWTCCVWLKNLLTSKRRETYSYLSASNSNNAHCSGLISNGGKYGAATNLYGGYDAVTTISGMNTNWHLVTITCNGTNLSIYVDNGQPYQVSVTNKNNDFVLCDVGSRNDVYTTQYRYGYLSNFIVENKVRTAQEISDYYNLTKGNYGL